MSGIGAISRAARPEAVQGVRLLAYDEFDRYPDGAITGQRPLVGPVWECTGAALPTIVGGKLVSGTGLASQSGYAFLHFDEAPTYIESVNTLHRIAAGAEDDGNAMVWSTDDLGKLLHFTFTSLGWNITLRWEDGVFEGFMGGNWAAPLRIDGVTQYRVAIAVEGSRVTVIGPNGEIFSHSDTRIPTFAALTAIYFEPSSGVHTGMRQTSIRVLARHPEQDQREGLAPTDQNTGIVATGLNGLVAAPETFNEVLIGKGGGSGMAAIEFGPATIRTWLTEDVAIGATTIKVELPLKPGPVQLGFGTSKEVVTVVGAPNPLSPQASRNFTMTLSAPTAKAQAAFRPAVQWGLTDRAALVWNNYAGYLQASKALEVNGFLKFASIVYDPNFLQLLTTRRQGWTTAPTGTKTRTTFDPATVTLPELAERVAALIKDLRDHGLIGP